MADRRPALPALVIPDGSVPDLDSLGSGSTVSDLGQSPVDTFLQLDIVQLTSPDLNPDESCPICRETYGNGSNGHERPIWIVDCGHVFGDDCLRSHVTTGYPDCNRCPICRNHLFEVVGPSTANFEPDAPDYDYWSDDSEFELDTDSDDGDDDDRFDEDENIPEEFLELELLRIDYDDEIMLLDVYRDRLSMWRTLRDQLIDNLPLNAPTAIPVILKLTADITSTVAKYRDTREDLRQHRRQLLAWAAQHQVQVEFETIVKRCEEGETMECAWEEVLGDWWRDEE